MKSHITTAHSTIEAQSENTAKSKADASPKSISRDEEDLLERLRDLADRRQEFEEDNTLSWQGALAPELRRAAKTITTLLSRLQSLTAENERLRGGLESIANGPVPVTFEAYRHRAQNILKGEKA